MNFVEKAIEAWRQAERESLELKQRMEEARKEEAREALLRQLKSMGVGEDEIEFVPVPEKEVWWEARVGGLRFRYLPVFSDYRALGKALHVAGRCEVHGCENPAWYEVGNLVRLGAVLAGQAPPKPCPECERRLREAALAPEKPRGKVCPLLSVAQSFLEECAKERCAWWRDGCAVAALEVRAG